MGLLSSWTTGSASRSVSSTRSSKPHPVAHHAHGQPPKDDAELAELVAATRAALEDAAEVDRLLRLSGEEPLTDAQIQR